MDGREIAFQHVSIGNPQCAIRVAEGLEELDLAAIGPPIEHSELFPNRTNVSFFRVDGDGSRAGANLRARGGGDAVLRDRGIRGGGGRGARRRAQPGDRRAGRRRARGRGQPRSGRDAHRAGPSPSSAASSRTSSWPSWSARREAGRAPGAHSALPVRPARAEDRRQEGRRRRRDLARHRGSRHANSSQRRRGDGAGGARPEHPHVPVEPGPAGVPRGGDVLLPNALRRGARPRDAGDARDRRQGVHLQHQLRVPRRGRRGARGRPRLSALHRRPADRGRTAGADAARAGAGLRSGPGRRFRNPRSSARG